MDVPPADLEYTCPRCNQPAVGRFFGPCGSCAAALGAAYPGAARDDVVAEEYEPKMNVTPNAVATKD